MKVYLECLPCILRQVLEASRMATDNEEAQERVMDQTIELLTRRHQYRNSPEIALYMHDIVKAETGNADPFREMKDRDLKTALRLLPILREKIERSDDPLYWSVKAAATGNVLDSAIALTYDTDGLNTEFDKPFTVCDLPVFTEKLKSAKHLLVIGDNTGETVFDTLLLSQLQKQYPDLRLTYAVRSAPIINDATKEEAIASGIDQYAEIMPSGCTVPGVLEEQCTPEFLEVFQNADIVISKGQGNYESLSDYPRDIFFLLKAKCPLLAWHLGVTLGDYVFKFRPSPV